MEQFYEQVKKTSAAILINNKRIGSGVVFVWQKQLFFLTAAHNLYGLEFEKEFVKEDCRIVDYNGNSHFVSNSNGDVDFSKKCDVALLTLECSSTLSDFILPYFASMPEITDSEFFFRGSYGKGETTVNKPGIRFLEPISNSIHQFLGIIDKSQLVNHLFSNGSEWMGGFSGSGLFLQDREEVILVGILLEIPDKGDNGQLQLSSVDVLPHLGLNITLLKKEIYRYNPSEFTNIWFSSRLSSSIDALGKRYTPELNFKLPVAEVFDGISRNLEFKKELDQYYGDVFVARRNCYTAFNYDFSKNAEQRLSETLSYLKSSYKDLLIDGFKVLEFEPLRTRCSEADAILSTLLDSFFIAQESIEKKDPTPRYQSLPYSSEIHSINRLLNSLHAFSEFLDSVTVASVNNPSIILKGDAGFGKSHLLADFANKRSSIGKFTLLVPGNLFVGTEDPWYQIIKKYYNFQFSTEEFLGKLDVKAHLSGHRILIIIDAINEGNGKEIWPDHLKSFIKTVRSYDGLGVVLSVRSSYFDLIINKSIFQENLAEFVTHYGFSEFEHEASDYFFDNYNIKKPRIPLLHPEFRSPLFLKLFCDGLHTNGMNEIPEGYEGISSILNFFLDAINKKLARLGHYDVKVNVVRLAVEALAVNLFESNDTYIAYADAVYFFNDLPALRISPDKHLFAERLVEEGVLLKNTFRKNDGTNVEGVSFLYERFFDHLVSAYILRNLQSKPIGIFQEHGPMFQLFNTESVCYENSGLIEALSIQVPEKFDLEFFELVPHVSESQVVIGSLIKSLIWRKKESLQNGREKKILFFLNKVGIQDGRMWLFFKKNILLIASVPGNVFNADFWHRNLIKQSVADRDSDFTQWLTENYLTKNSEVKKLIDWAWKDEFRQNIADESAQLSGVMLAWFLVSPHREIRDGATKAIVSLMYKREYLIVDLLKKFEHVNDPYVYERLFCIAYGCSLRADNLNFLAELANYTFTQVFKKRIVYPNLLLRDYARGIISFAEKNGIPLDFAIGKSIPPYRSKQISKFPTNEQIDKKYKISGHDSAFYIYQNAILDSMVTEYGRGIGGYGDFGRYTFQSALSDWKVSASKLSNYAVQRVFDLGYNANLHGKYDSKQNSGRGQGPAERIGKKYQWIAFQEILARTADHCEMIDEVDGKSITKYLGPWQPGVRDIDPTMIIRKTSSRDHTYVVNSDPWWQMKTDLDFNTSNLDWMLLENDLPSLTNQLILKNTKGEEWICLDINLREAEEVELGEDQYETPKKVFFAEIAAYIVDEDQIENFESFCTNENIINESLPQPTSQTRIFSREYFWSESFHYIQQPFFGGDGDNEFRSNAGRFIANIHAPTQLFHWEKERDHSKTDTIIFRKPSAKLFKGLKMRYSHLEGEFNGQAGNIVCLDPSVNAAGPSCLLIRRNLLEAYLLENKLRLCWYIYGGKQIQGGGLLKDSFNPKVQHIVTGFYSLNSLGIKGGMKSIISSF